MATTATIELTDEQIKHLSLSLRVSKTNIPTKISVMAISPEAASSMGLASNELALSPALIVT